MGKNNNNAGYEFTAIILFLFVPTLLIFFPIIVLYFINKPAAGGDFLYFAGLFLAPALIAGVSHGLMGLEVNRIIKRIDLLQGGLEFEIIKIYYNEIAKKKKMPVVFILFVCSATLLVGEIIWFKVIKGGFLAMMLFAVLVGSLLALRHYTKKGLWKNKEIRKD